MKVGTSLFDLLSSLSPVCVDGLTDDIFQSILDARRCSFEDDEDLEQLCDLEFVLDCFDAGERKALETEIKDAKEKKSLRTSFDEAVCNWKV